MLPILQYFRASQFSRPHFIASYLLLMARIYYPLLQISLQLAIGITFPTLTSHYIAGHGPRLQIRVAFSLLTLDTIW